MIGPDFGKPFRVSSAAADAGVEGIVDRRQREQIRDGRPMLLAMALRES